MKTDPPSVLPGLPRGRDRALMDARGQTEPGIWPRTRWAWLWWEDSACALGRPRPGWTPHTSLPSGAAVPHRPHVTWAVHWEPMAPGASQPALHSGHCLRWGFYSDGRAISPNRAGGASPMLVLEGFGGLRWGGQGQAEVSGSAWEPLPPRGARPRRGRGCRIAGSTWKQSW